MPRASNYPLEFRERCVRIARESERSITAVVHDLGVHPEPLRLWVRLDEADDGTRHDRLATSRITDRLRAEWVIGFERNTHAIGPAGRGESDA